MGDIDFILDLLTGRKFSRTESNPCTMMQTRREHRTNQGFGDRYYSSRIDDHHLETVIHHRTVGKHDRRNTINRLHAKVNGKQIVNGAADAYNVS